jgi:hypothetical protein
MNLLQISATDGAAKLLDYGTLGVMAFLLIAVVVYLERQRSSYNKATDLRITKLEDDLRIKNKEYDDFLNKAYAEAIEINRKCVELLQEVKDFFRGKNIQ